MVKSLMNEKRLSVARGARREAILGIAREVFSAEGYAAASMSHIASRLGGSKGTLYNYFKSKEELFAAHVQDQCECRVAEAFAPPLVGDDPVDILAGLAERVLTALLADEATAFYSLIVSEAQRNPSVGQAFYESGPSKGIRRVADYLESAQAKGQIASDDCVMAAEEFLGLVQSGLHFKRVLNIIPQPSADEIRAKARRAAETFMRAYAPRPS
ncbi:MAG: transcriptional regulator, TetR family [Rhodospirillales bacterium]|nr:transcriptional regulator, TetR family [Rhodospirillales bacterium]